MKDTKHLAFLLDCPEPGNMMMFCAFYEDLEAYINEKYDEVDKNAVQLGVSWKDKLTKQKYKVFKTKSIIQSL